jgi:hypothetical protein
MSVGRQEADLIELSGDRIVGTEIFDEPFVHGLVLHTGPPLFELSDRITTAPIAALWSLGRVVPDAGTVLARFAGWAEALRYNHPWRSPSFRAAKCRGATPSGAVSIPRLTT